jgi:superfamily II DNA/RNA helicase
MYPQNMISWGEGQREALEVFIAAKEGIITRNTNLLTTLNKEKADLRTRIEALESTVAVGKSKVKSEVDEMASRHGSKSAKLIRYLQGMKDNEQTIVFSFWHDTLSLVHRSLNRCGISVTFCNGTSQNMVKAITDFTTGAKSVLLLSAQSKASGANLQCATTVILLDPAGSSAQHGAALEQQAIGRAVRMGQANPVKVVRFCVKDTIEGALFDRIDEAARMLEQRSNDLNYLCESSHKSFVSEKDEVAEDDPDDCCIGETLTDRERVSRMYQAALANNDVICIDVDDDSDELAVNKPEPSSTNVCAPIHKESSNTEAVNGKRTNENSNAIVHTDKRAKVVTEDDKANSPKASVSFNVITQHHDVSSEIINAPQESQSPQFVSTKFTYKDINWLEKFEQLKLHKAKTGLAWVPGQMNELSKWCSCQRQSFKKGSMSAARVKALNDIGFPWTHADTFGKQATPGKVYCPNEAQSLPLVTPSLKTKFHAASLYKFDGVVSPSDDQGTGENHFN